MSTTVEQYLYEVQRENEARSADGLHWIVRGSGGWGQPQGIMSYLKSIGPEPESENPEIRRAYYPLSSYLIVHVDRTPDTRHVYAGLGGIDPDKGDPRFTLHLIPLPQRGGRREGAGRKPNTDKGLPPALVNYTVRLPPEMADYAEKHGGPDLVRSLIQRAIEADS